jgi:hypothetical protein
MPDAPSQDDVLRKKDHVTKSGRGLQRWDEDADAAEGQAGTGSEGTAGRASRIARGQRKGPEP